jgi:hypothetical protein
MSLALFISFSCTVSNQNGTTISNVQNQTPQNTNLSVSSELAIQNAKEFISSEYDLLLYDAVILDENENTWTIGFAFKPKYKGRTGGQPTVEVDKKTGNIGRYYFPK